MLCQRTTHVAVEVNVLRVATNCNGSIGGDTIVDAINRTERIYINLEVGERLVRAWLKGCGIAAGIDIEGVN